MPPLAQLHAATPAFCLLHPPRAMTDPEHDRQRVLARMHDTARDVAGDGGALPTFTALVNEHPDLIPAGYSRHAQRRTRRAYRTWRMRHRMTAA